MLVEDNTILTDRTVTQKPLSGRAVGGVRCYDHIARAMCSQGQGIYIANRQGEATRPDYF